MNDLKFFDYNFLKYDKNRMIYKNLKKLHSDDLIRLKERVPFSQEED